MDEEMNAGGDLVLFHLLTGETIVGKALHTMTDEDVEVVLKNCIRLESVPTPNGIQVMVLPYGNFCDGAKIVLNALAIAWSGIPNDQITSEYNRVFGSGIVVPPAAGKIVDVAGIPLQ